MTLWKIDEGKIRPLRTSYITPNPVVPEGGNDVKIHKRAATAKTQHRLLLHMLRLLIHSGKIHHVKRNPTMHAQIYNTSENQHTRQRLVLSSQLFSSVQTHEFFSHRLVVYGIHVNPRPLGHVRRHLLSKSLAPNSPDITKQNTRCKGLAGGQQRYPHSKTNLSWPTRRQVDHVRVLTYIQTTIVIPSHPILSTRLYVSLTCHSHHRLLRLFLLAPRSRHHCPLAHHHPPPFPAYRRCNALRP